MSQTLEELKAENEAEEAAVREQEEAAKANKDVEEDLEEEEDPDAEPELDKDGNPVEKKPLEPWLDTGEEDGAGDGEDYSLKKGDRSQPDIEGLKRPLADEFDDDEAYHKALDEYDDARANARSAHRQSEASTLEAQRKAKENVGKATDEHYERVDALVNNGVVSQEAYKKSDQTVRDALESVRPKFGNAIMDSMIMIAGEGSEKVFHYLGINKPALNKMKVLLSEDKSGLRLATYIGRLNERLTNPKKKTSQAHKPHVKVKGDAPKASGALQKKYKKAHEENRGQDAWNIKKQAKAAGTDVSTW